MIFSTCVGYAILHHMAKLIRVDEALLTISKKVTFLFQFKNT